MYHYWNNPLVIGDITIEAMALIEIVGLPNLKMVDLERSSQTVNVYRRVSTIFCVGLTHHNPIQLPFYMSRYS